MEKFDQTQFWIYQIRLELNLIFKLYGISKEKIVAWIFHGVGVDLSINKITEFSYDEAIKVFSFIEKDYNHNKLIGKSLLK